MDKLENVIKNSNIVHRDKQKWINYVVKNGGVSINNRIVKDKTIDVVPHKVRMNRIPIQLGYKEMDLLKVLIRNKRILYAKKHIISKTAYQKKLSYQKGYKNFYNSKIKKDIEKYLDVILVRLGYAMDIRESRKLIKYGNVKIDNKIVYKNLKVKNCSTITVNYSRYPFMELYKYMLENYIFTKRIHRREKNLYRFLKMKTNKKTNEYKVKRKVMRYQFPIAKYPDNFLKLNRNKSFYLKPIMKKDIKVPIYLRSY